MAQFGIVVDTSYVCSHLLVSKYAENKTFVNKYRIIVAIVE
jgi:hypothetical protein